MSDDLSSKCVVIRDNGLHFPLALQLREAFGRVLYSTDLDHEYPSVMQSCIGDGFPGVERCDDPFLLHNEIDLWVYPNRGHAGEQLLLESMGKRVFGGRLGTELESHRRRFRKLQSNLGMDVPEYVVVTGIANLREHLRPLEKKWIKIDRFRRDCETWQWRSWDESRYMLDRLAVRFGPLQDDIPFIVEDEIVTEIETGGDLISIDGAFADHAVIGFEAKDKTYLASLRTWEQLDDAIKEVIEPLAPILKGFRYRNFLSTEQRITKRDNILTDITPRLGCPSGNCQLRLYGNVPELLWHGAAGELLPIQPKFKFAIECIMEHNCPEVDWRCIKFPDSVLPYVNFIGPVKSKVPGLTHFTPNDIHDTSIGSVSGEGNTIKECMEDLKAHVEAISDQPITVRLDTIKDLLEEVETAEKQKIEFTEQAIPEPEEVLNDA
jgi:hypothetical protein